jgi:hypothetical protein
VVGSRDELKPLRRRGPAELPRRLAPAVLVPAGREEELAPGDAVDLPPVEAVPARVVDPGELDDRPGRIRPSDAAYRVAIAPMLAPATTIFSTPFPRT